MYSDYRSLFSNFMWLWISPLFSPSSIHNCFVTAQAGCPFHFLGVSVHVCKLCQCAFFLVYKVSCTISAILDCVASSHADLGMRLK